MRRVVRARASSLRALVTHRHKGAATHCSVLYRRGKGAPAGALVLNATYEPLCVVSIRRAVVLVLGEKAEVVEATGARLHSERLSVPSSRANYSPLPEARFALAVPAGRSRTRPLI